MQAAGIAEADPTLDVDGWDAAAKTAALLNVLFDAGVTPQAIQRTGIAELSATEVKRARDEGQRIRLVVRAGWRDGRVTGAVAPERLPADDVLARLEGGDNAVIFETEALGDVAVTELGGSLRATAYALLADLITIARRLRGPA